MPRWAALSEYNLRHIAGHLAAAGRPADVERVVLDLGYLHELASRSGFATALDIVGEVATNPALEREVLDLVGRMVALLAAEASSISDGDDRLPLGPFVNHLVAAARRRDEVLAERLRWDEGDLSQAGWLDLVGTWGARAGGPVATYILPGERASYGWDVYDAGPMGSETRVAVDVARGRLLAEIETLRSYGFSTYESTYRWRIWDLRSGTLLYESVSPQLAKEDGQADPPRPKAFVDPHLARPPERPNWDDPRPDVVQELLGQAGGSVPCANGPEVAFLGHDGVCAVTDANTGTLAVVRLPAAWTPPLLARVRGQLMLIGVGRDDNVHVVTVLMGDDGCRTLDAGVTNLHVDGRDGSVRWTIGTVGWRYDQRSPEPSVVPSRPARLDGERWQSELDGGEAALTDVGPPPAASGTERAATLAEPSNFPVAPYDSLEAEGDSPGGRYVFEKRRISIGLWDRSDGRWLGALTAREGYYGGGGLLPAWAVTPDDRQIVAAVDGRQLVVWNLDQHERRSPIGTRLPDWTINGIDLGGVRRLAFLWGGWLLAATTERRRLSVLRFWHTSEVLATVGLEDDAEQLECPPYDDSVFALSRSGRLTQYRFRFRSGPGVTRLDGHRLVVQVRVDADRLELLGSFTGWDPLPMHLHQGVWRAEVQVGPGDHTYKLRAGPDRWVLDPHVPWRPGPLGSDNWIAVPGST